MVDRLIFEFLHRQPRLKNAIYAALNKAHLIFVDYPVKSEPRYGYGKGPHPKLYEIINRDREIYREHLESFLQYADYFTRIPLRERDDHVAEPSWVNRWIPALDAVGIYGLLSKHNPHLYFEIGSGASTKFARRAVDDQKLRTTITSIDPAPRHEIDVICDTVVRKRIEDVNIALFDKLNDGDMLFVDNSHRIFTNSDVTIIFLDILPRLKPGVIVGFHDIFLPSDYPPQWKYRYYSEQYLLAAYLLAEGKKCRILLPNSFIYDDPELRAVLGPLWRDKRMAGVLTFGSSFWIRLT